MDNFNISNCKDTIVKVFLIGYKKRGESIVIIFLDKSNQDVIYSIVIDSFSYKKVNKTIDILNRFNISSIDMLCWSHPDLDHTWGIDNILKNYCDQHTKIILPFALTDPNFNSYNFNKNDKKYLEYIFSLNILSKHSCITSSVAPNGFSRICDFKITDFINNILVQIDTLSPHSSLINFLISTQGKIEKNQLSIVLLLSINSYKFVFCSDIENDGIAYLKKDAFDNPILIKIPHHGSPTSDDIFSFLDTSLSNTIGCTTIYHQHKLPNREIIKQYNKYCVQIDCTGTNDKDLYGIVEYSFDLFDTFTCDVYYHGHAYTF